MTKKKNYIVLLFLSLGLLIKAQDLRYSQAYIFAPSINPSLTGLGNAYKFGFLHRNQWSKSPSNSLSTGFNFELSSKNEDLAGALIVNQTKMTDDLVHNEIGFSIRKSIQFGADNELYFGLSTSYGNYVIDSDKLVFGDQLNINGTISDVTFENVDAIGSKSYLNLGFGISARLDKLVLGMATKYLNSPNTSLVGEDTKQPVHFHFLTAYDFGTTIRNIPFMESNQVFDIHIRPFIVFETQNRFTAIDFGSYLVIEPILFGFKYRGLAFINENQYNIKNKDAITLILGYELEKVNFSYSYDIILTDVNNSGGTHEIGLIFRKPSIKKNRAIYF